MNGMTLSKSADGSELRISTRGPFKLKRRPGRKTLLMPPETAEGHLAGSCLDQSSHLTLFQGLARAHYWQRLLDAGEVGSGTEIAKLEGLHPSTVNELLRMTLLDPSFVMDILEGRPPQGVSMLWFATNALPNLWQEQFGSGQAI